MSTHVDPTKDHYLKLEKKLGAAESALAADLAEANKAIDAPIEKPNKASATRTEFKRKVDALSQKHDRN